MAVQDIRKSTRKKLSGVLTAPAVLAIALILSTGCSRDIEETPAKVFGGPAEVTLIIGNGSGDTKSGNPETKSSYIVDEDTPVHTVRIYAFKHAPGDEQQNNECVGYGYFEGLSGNGPYYLPVSLSASGDIDFYVIANDRYAVSGASEGQDTSLDENSSRGDIEGFRFTGLYSDGMPDGETAIPMSNIMTGAIENIGTPGNENSGNNFSFSISDDNSGIPPIIPIDITRAMARLSLYFAKDNDDIEIKIEAATLHQGPTSAQMFSADGAPAYDDNVSGDRFVSPVFITKENTTGSLEEEALQKIEEETYILPNTHGSNDADDFMAEENSDKTKSYLLEISYRINGESRHKLVYLPPVRPNDWIKVKGIFSSRTDVTMNVIVNSWTEHNIDVPPFE